MREQLAMSKMVPKPLRGLLLRMLRLIQFLAFIAAYLVLDWASYLHPLHGLNITLWNPAPALGLVLWVRFGRVTAIPWFAAIMIGEFAIRGMPATFAMTTVVSVTLAVGYGVIGEIIRRRLPDGEVFGDRQRLITWLGIVGVGTLANSLIYISLLALSGLLPAGERGEALIRFWVGDCVGILVSMPMLWMMLTKPGQARLRIVLASWETGGYAVLAFVMLWVTFFSGPSAEFQYFYFLFLPVIWAASRQGLSGAATSAFILQAGIITAVEWLNLIAVTVMEFQMLGAVLALTGFFIGVLVDEQRLAAEKLKQTLRMAAAGEMAAALAHELNQPMTALAAYGDACEQLVARGDTGEALLNAIRRMVSESTRAAEVVRRVRDLFRTGATRLETFDLAVVMSSVADRFADRAAVENVELNVVPMSATVLADRLQIELVLRNLISNAFDAVASRPCGERRIDVSAEEEGNGRVVIVVSDSGPGLSASEVNGLFEPFVSTKSSGLGLGLVISRAIVDAHGGKLWVEAGDRGIFRFSLASHDQEATDAKT